MLCIDELNQCVQQKKKEGNNINTSFDVESVRLFDSVYNPGPGFPKAL